jgi:hypothetical protein
MFRLHLGEREMNIDRKIVEQALEALMLCQPTSIVPLVAEKRRASLAALRAALEQPDAVPEEIKEKAYNTLMNSLQKTKRQRDIAVAALERISALEGTEDNEWDALEVVIPKMTEIARGTLEAIK